MAAKLLRVFCNLTKSILSTFFKTIGKDSEKVSTRGNKTEKLTLIRLYLLYYRFFFSILFSKLNKDNNTNKSKLLSTKDK